MQPEIPVSDPKPKESRPPEELIYVGMSREKWLRVIEVIGDADLDPELTEAFRSLREQFSAQVNGHGSDQ